MSGKLETAQSILAKIHERLPTTLQIFSSSAVITENTLNSFRRETDKRVHTYRYTTQELQTYMAILCGYIFELVHYHICLKIQWVEIFQNPSIFGY